LVFVLVGLIFMAAGPSTAKAEFGVVVNPCMYPWYVHRCLQKNSQGKVS
jgi:hypothetical protein